MSENARYLVLLETAGNQAYIFATNRLRENVGASQRVWEAGVDLTYRAAKKVTGCAGFDKLRESAKCGPGSYAKAMKCAPRLGDGVTIEVVLATSGKALFLAQEEKAAKELIAFATRTALEEAPGLTLRGAIVPIVGNCAAAANRAVKAVHEEIEAIRDRLPAPEIRFPTIPILEPCASSGLPAAEIPCKKVYGSDPKPSSDVTIAKRKAHEDAVTRISKLVGLHPEELGKNIGEMEKKVDWIGIVHADGNGMGQLFLGFGEICEETTVQGYFDAYRRLSLSLDLCGVAAFQAALKKTYPASGDGDRGLEVAGQDASHLPARDGKHREHDKRKRIPLLPLVLGGDDLTVLCDGRIAVHFAAAYLEAFQEQTTKCKVLGQSSSIPEILENKSRLENEGGSAHGDQRNTGDWRSLGAAAGIAITKPHYPFHRGYELAESLLKEAKTAKTKLGVSRCALDFHVLFDGAETSLDDLRERWTLPTGERLTARPYVLKTDQLQENEAEADENEWARHRGWEDLLRAERALAGLEGHDEKDGGLPRSQQYALRAALFRGAAAADRQLALVRHRYGDFHWATLMHESEGKASLFFPLDKGGLRACRLLDALEVADLGAADLGTEDAS